MADMSRYYAHLDEVEARSAERRREQEARRLSRPQPGQNRSALGDTMTDLKAGALRIPGTLAALADIPWGLATGEAPIQHLTGAIGEATGFQPGRWGEEAQRDLSPARQAADARVNVAKEEAEALRQQGKWGQALGRSITGVLSEPRSAIGLAAQSLPEMAVGGVAGRGLRAAGIAKSPYVAAGAGEGMIMAGHQMGDLTKEGVDPRTAAAAGVVTGLLGGAIGVGGGYLSKRLGVFDPDVLMVAGREGVEATASNTLRGSALNMARRIGGGVVSEGLFEEFPQETMEAIVGNIAAGRDPMENAIFQGIQGAAAGGIMGGTINIVSPRAAKETRATTNPRDLLRREEERRARAEQGELEFGYSGEEAIGTSGIINPYDVGGRVSAVQRGEEPTVDSQQRPLFGEPGDALPEDTVVPFAELRAAAPSAFKKDGSLNSLAARAFAAYSEMDNEQLALAIDELSRADTAKWRVPMLEYILSTRPQEARDGTTNVAPASGTRGSSEPVGGGRDLLADVRVGGGVRPDAPAPAPSVRADTPVGDAGAADSALMRVRQLNTIINHPSAPEQAKALARQELAQIEEAQTTATDTDMVPTLLNGLTGKQREVLVGMQEAVGTDVEANKTAVAEALGISKQALNGRLKSARKAMTEAAQTRYGLTKAEAEKRIADYFLSRRATETADETRLGDRPDEQAQTVDLQEVLGGEDVDQSMGTIQSVGGTQARTDEDVEATAMAAARPDPVAERRAAEAHAKREAAIAEALAHPIAPEAMEDWDSMRSEGAPTSAELDRDSALEWILNFARMKEGEITANELDRIQLEIEREFQTASLRGEVGEQRTVGSEPRPALQQPTEVVAGDGGTDPETAGTPEVTEEVVEEATGEVDAAEAGFVAGSSPLERRVAALRERLGERQRATLDRLIDRFTKREIEFDRFDDELKTLEARAAQGVQYSKIDVEADYLIYDGKAVPTAFSMELGWNADGVPVETESDLRGRALLAVQRRYRELLFGSSERFLQRHSFETLIETVKKGVVDGLRMSAQGPDHALADAVSKLDSSKFSSQRNDIAKKKEDALRNRQRAVYEAAERGEGLVLPPEQDALFVKWVKHIGERIRFVADYDGEPEIGILTNISSYLIKDYQNWDINPRYFLHFMAEITNSEGEVQTTPLDNSSLQTMGIRRSQTAEAPQPTTVDAVWAALEDITSDIRKGKVVVVQSADALVERGLLNSETARGVQGFVDNKGTAYFIADNIKPGLERAVVLHEIGAHLGIENILPGAQYLQLVNKVVAWAESGKGLEGYLARRAIARVDKAGTEGVMDQQKELIAYFVEEAVLNGIDPTALQYKSEMGRWFRTLWAAFKRAVRRLGTVNADKLTAQDVVDLAYGAARIELSATYHGTAAAFRRFNHAFMGSGEGSQYFGWGSYLAQRFGIAREYFKQDVRRKAADGRTLSDYPDIAALKAAAEADDYLGFNHLAEVTTLARASGVQDMRSKWEMSDALAAELDKYLVWRNAGAPEGNIHIVDTIVTPEEMLDWDVPLDQQPAVVAEALERINAALTPSGVEYLRNSFNSERVQDVATKWLVRRMLPEMIKDGHLTVEGEAALRHVAEGNYPAAASMWLNEMGVKGIRFLDAMSRDPDKRPTLAQLGRLDLVGGYNDIDLGSVELRDVAQFRIFGVNESLQVRLSDLHGNLWMYVENLTPTDGQDWDVDVIRDAVKAYSQQQTRNLVIFDDRNLYRVASHRGGSAREGGRLLFSKADTEQNARESNGLMSRVLKSLPQPVQDRLTALNTRVKQAAYLGAFSSDLVDMVSKHLPQAGSYFDTIFQRQAERTSREADLQAILDPLAALPQKEIAQVNELLLDSAFQEAWAFDPDWVDGVEVNGELNARFEALPAEAQKAIIRMFRKAHELRVELDTLMEEDIDTTYSTMMLRAKSKKQRKKLEDQYNRVLSGFNKRKALYDRPYLPLKRWGEFAVVMRSQAFRDAQAEGNTSLVEQMKADPSHYRVTFTESEVEALDLRRRWQEETGNPVDAPFPRADYVKRNEHMPFELLQRLKAQVTEGTDEPSKAIHNALDKLYIQALEETSIRKSELHRRKVYGMDHDMIRAFRDHGVGHASMIAALTINKETQGQIAAMREAAFDPTISGEVRKNRILALNEVMARHALSLDYNETWSTNLVRKAMGTTSIWMLLSSPAYYIQNATQPFMLTLPVLAAKFNPVQAADHMFEAYKHIWKGWEATRRGKSGEVMNIDAALAGGGINESEAVMLRRLQNRGLLDIGIAADLGSLETAKSQVGKVVNRVHRKMITAARTVELANRGVTALAAYRLELARLEQETQFGEAERHARATEYAEYVTSVSQGDYSQANAPRFIASSPVMRLITQFRKFQLIQIGLLARSYHKAFHNADAIERSIGKRQLSYILGMHGLVGGAMGLPAMNIAGMVIGAAMGGDDPPDFETRARRAIGDKDTADLILKGLPAYLGVDASTRLGMGMTFSLMPFTQVSMSRDGAAVAMANLMGPGAGLLMRFADGVRHMNQGNAVLGVANFMPGAVGNTLKALDARVSGVYTRNYKDVLLTPDEVSFMASFSQAMGWPIKSISDPMMVRGKKFEAEAHFNERAQKVRRAYIEAYRSGDGAARRSAMEDWRALQATRREWGFSAQPLSNLLRAPRDQAKRERETLGGVQATQTSRGFVELLQR